MEKKLKQKQDERRCKFPTSKNQKIVILNVKVTEMRAKENIGNVAWKQLTVRIQHITSSKHRKKNDIEEQTKKEGKIRRGRK